MKTLIITSSGRFYLLDYHSSYEDVSVYNGETTSLIITLSGKDIEVLDIAKQVFVYSLN